MFSLLPVRKEKMMIYTRMMHVYHLRWKRQLSETRTLSAMHAGCVERKTHGVWSATYVTMIFVRNASATAYGEKEREKWREYVLSLSKDNFAPTALHLLLIMR